MNIGSALGAQSLGVAMSIRATLCSINPNCRATSVRCSNSYPFTHSSLAALKPGLSNLGEIK